MIKKLGFYVLRCMLSSSERMKRLVLLSSFLAVLEDREVTEAELTLLNAQLSLCSELNSLRLPMLWKSELWPIPQIRELVLRIRAIHSENIETAIEIKELVQLIPDWLRYKDDQSVADDLLSVIRFEEKYAHQ